MINELTKLYEGRNLSGAKSGVIYLPILKNGTLKAVDVMTDESVSGANAIFNLHLNGVEIAGAGVTVNAGSRIGSITGLDVELTKGDEILLNLVSGSISSPITLNLSVDDGETAGGAGAWTTVKKTADEQRVSNTVLSNDAELHFPIAANKTYVIRLLAFIYTASATPNIKFGLAAPAVTLVCGEQRTGAANFAPSSATTIADFSTLPTNQSLSASPLGFIEYKITVRCGAGGGTFAFQFAQGTSSADQTNILAGSYLEYIEI
ncbi:MAG TPA: hypothetical protein VF599_12440 [Pyrinomonadaceae bacterium]|jgi:hypothetical protein